MNSVWMVTVVAWRLICSQYTENKIIILNKPLREMFRIYYDKFLDNPILQYTYITCYGLVIIRTK